MSWPSWLRTRKLRGQGPAGLPNSPNGHRVGEAGVEPATAQRLGPAALPNWTYSPVRRENYDIPTVRLRGNRSSFELPALGADEENRTPVLSLEDCCSAIELHPHRGSRR